MATVAIARFGGVLRSSGTASRSLRTIAAGPMSLASARRAAAGSLSGSCSSSSNKRCMSTLYSPSHEYIKTEGDTGTVGITGFAAKALGDVVFVDLPSVGDTFEAGDSFGSVESVKAASDVYAPAKGEVVEVNEALSETPGILNEDPEGTGWFMKIKINGEAPDTLMNPDAYKEHCAKEG